jgi:hypothetical protein
MIRSKLAIIITAAGSSTRIGGGIKKEYLPYKKGTVLSSCAETFLNACYDRYEITDFIDLGNNGYDIFSMELIKYYNFKEFAICGLRNGKILGVDIANKRIEFSKHKINDTGKDNEMIVKKGKLTFYGENISYISKVENTNMILVASHDHILKLIEY